MATESNSESKSETYREIATSHIRALSTLSTSLPPILIASATTVSQLTNAPINPTSPDTPASRQAAISASANEYFTAVFELARALHEQVEDLEAQGVIPSEEVKFRAPVKEEVDVAQHGHSQTMTKDSEASVTHGGLGEFDIGVLNAKAGIRQRRGEEVLERVKRVLEDLEKKVEGNGQDKMNVDVDD